MGANDKARDVINSVGEEEQKASDIQDAVNVGLEGAAVYYNENGDESGFNHDGTDDRYINLATGKTDNVTNGTNTESLIFTNGHEIGHYISDSEGFADMVGNESVKDWKIVNWIYGDSVQTSPSVTPQSFANHNGVGSAPITQIGQLGQAVFLYNNNQQAAAVPEDERHNLDPFTPDDTIAGCAVGGPWGCVIGAAADLVELTLVMMTAKAASDALKEGFDSNQNSGSIFSTPESQDNSGNVLSTPIIDNNDSNILSTPVAENLRPVNQGFGAGVDISDTSVLHNRDANYVKAPGSLPAFPDALPAKAKTPVKGGGGLRKRWKDRKGNIYEWDSQHGTVEKYNKTGKKHLGEFDAKTGKQTKPANPTRTVEK